MFAKCQAKIVGLLSTLTRKITTYGVILFLTLSSANIASAQSRKFWVYFTDKNDGQIVEISNKAFERRNFRGSTARFDEYDRMPDRAYIQALKGAGLTVHVISRWLNAASVSGPMQSLNNIKNLSFVKKVSPVAAFRRERLESQEIGPSIAKSLSPPFFPAIDYGPSYTQLHLCQIDSLQSLGFTGEGVLIGIMDTGFRLDHPFLEHLSQTGNIIATHDFINGDNNVQDSVNLQQEHGTAVWSVIGAYAEGSLIGGAYDADFLLAKTEIEAEEIQAEEDNWIAAMEWMESQGVDIVSSSVGYFDWYTQSQLDGHTAAITIAADIANSLGVIVVNSAGNERNTAWGTIIAPADGDSVIAAGGVTADGLLWAGSSPGPTADGRIKPDVCAMALGVIAAYYYSDSYRGFSGTSMAAPIIASGLALILQAHPAWNLSDIIFNLKSTATRAQAPDNDYGWGIARFFNMYSGQIPAPLGGPFFVAPNPAFNSVVFRFNPALTANADIVIFDIAGDRITDLQLEPPSEGMNYYSWYPGNSSGREIADGIYIAYLQSQPGCYSTKFAYVKY